MLHLGPAVMLGLVLLPIAAGLAGTVLPAFGYLPAIGRETVSLAAWWELAATPGLVTSLTLTIGVGLSATLLSLLAAAGLIALTERHGRLRTVERLLAPLLATPHAALAIGFAFVVLPSGWLVRMVSPDLTGWTRPPDLVTVRDPVGVSLVLGLMLKEVPYLALMLVGALPQVPHRAVMAAGRSLGYTPVKAWLVGVFPLLYRQIRLPLYAVLAFSLAVVDVALVLGPGTPPPLAVQATRWFLDYDLALYPRAAAAAVLQLLIVGAMIGLWRGAECAAARLGRRWAACGRRTTLWRLPLGAGAALALVLMVAAVLALASLAIWSVAGPWRFPDAWPEALTLATWARQSAGVAEVAQRTLVIALAATALALVLVVAVLEHEASEGRRLRAMALLAVPLLVPPIAFVFGMQIALVRLGADGTWGAVIWSHLVFVIPYVYLSLADPYRALDPRYARAAASLGAGRLAVLLRVKLPMLLRPLLIAAAVGFAVSIGQYLTTLFAGAGRVATLTTEAVALAAGNDRRVLGVLGVLQAAMPAAAYALAIALPRLLHRERRGLA